MQGSSKGQRVTVQVGAAVALLCGIAAGPASGEQVTHGRTAADAPVVSLEFTARDIAQAVAMVAQKLGFAVAVVDTEDGGQAQARTEHRMHIVERPLETALDRVAGEFAYIWETVDGVYVFRPRPATPGEAARGVAEKLASVGEPPAPARVAAAIVEANARSQVGSTLSVPIAALSEVAQETVGRAVTQYLYTRWRADWERLGTALEALPAAERPPDFSAFLASGRVRVQGSRESGGLQIQCASPGQPEKAIGVGWTWIGRERPSR